LLENVWGMPATFFGWIPTVSGALSFSAFGDTSHAPRAVSANRADRDTRYLVCYRARDCSDILVPFKGVVGPWFLNLSGKLWFVCVGKSETHNGKQEMMEGQVLIFHDRELWRKNVSIVVRDAQELLKRYRYGTQPSIQNHFDYTLGELIDQLPALSAFNARFTISRVGLTTLELADNMKVHSTAPTLPDQQPSRDHVKHILAAQLFFFLRDIGHRHQHHDPYTDTIVDLWPETPRDPFYWKLQTLFSLYRKVISYKRLKAPESFTASLGVTAYAETFRAIIEEDATPEQLARLPHFHAENVRNSIHAVDYEMNRRRELSSSSSAVTRELILTSIALVIAIVGVFQIVDQKVPFQPARVLYVLAEFLITSPIFTIGLVAGSIFAVRVMIYNPSNNRLVRWLFRLVQTFDLRFAIAIFACLGFIGAVTLLKLLLD
jgi:hypothetical protein